MAELVCVAPSLVGQMWPHARALIKSALDRTKLTRFEDVEAQILAGQQLLWLAWDGEKIEAAASTQVDGDACVIVACGGKEHRNWLGLIEGIQKYAKDCGCKHVRIYGRPGWQRVLPEYRRKFVILERPL